VLAVVCCAGRATPVAQSPLPGDVDLLYEAAASACGVAWDALPDGDATAVTVEQAGQGEAAWLVEEALCQGLLERGWEIRGGNVRHSPSDTVETDGPLELEYRIVRTAVHYEPRGRGLWRAPLVQRRAEVELVFRVMDEDGGRLVWVGRGDGLASDVVPRSALRHLAHPELSPPEDDWPSSRSWALEGAAAAGLIGILLAVFYAGTV
jgi:hypothetical protein